MDAINVVLGSPALSGLFVASPVGCRGPTRSRSALQAGVRFDRDAPAIFGTSAAISTLGVGPRRARDRPTSDVFLRDTAVSSIVAASSSDPIFSIYDTIAWWRKLDAVNHGDASSFVRVYAVPGMNHCAGGPATDQFDALTTVVDWVEQSEPHPVIEARAGPMTPGLCSRPLYLSKIARYRSGDLNQAASFVLRGGEALKVTA